MTTLTKATRDRAVAALRRAHDEGRAKAEGHAWRPDGSVCACVIIAEAEGIETPVDDVMHLYRAVAALGFPTFTAGTSLTYPTVVRMNDYDVGRRRSTFDDVADMVAALDVVDEAEQICRDAVLVSA